MSSTFFERTLGLLRTKPGTYLRNSYLSRPFTSEQQPSAGERALKEKLRSKFPNATSVNVEDISGGCGSMYQINISSSEFKGMTTVKQHQLITQALKEEIKDMHGVRINTSIPNSS